MIALHRITALCHAIIGVYHCMQVINEQHKVLAWQRLYETMTYGHVSMLLICCLHHGQGAFCVRMPGIVCSWCSGCFDALLKNSLIMQSHTPAPTNVHYAECSPCCVPGTAKEHYNSD